MTSNEPNTEAGVVRDLAEKAAAREVLTLVDGKVLGVVLAEGQALEQIDLADYAEYPESKTGHVTLTDADSFVLYVMRHRIERATTLWSSVDAGTVIAVIDDHESIGDPGDGESFPGHGRHRATFKLTETPDWKHWLGRDGKFIGQIEFAEHLEEGASVIRQPSAADMLEIAQTFHAKTGVDFKSASRLSSGETKLVFEETIAARAGQKGSIEIPDQFTLAMQPFDGSETYEINARFRYRIQNGTLLLGYKLIRPDLVRKAAFIDLSGAISETVGLPVMAGVPRS